jgi:carboxypeptidase Q
MKITLLTFFCGLFFWANAQTPLHDTVMIRSLYDAALVNGKSYEMLGELCRIAPKRLSGSPGAAAAVEWGRQTMSALGFDSVWLQPVMVPCWVRGSKEYAKIITRHTGGQELTICSLGGSVATPTGGITTTAIEVQNFEELRQMPADKVKGKIVFFNRPMDPKLIYTFGAYGGCVGQRAYGADEAAAKGAIACVVRSMTLANDDHPHTGSVVYKNEQTKIPAVAISTKDADYLSNLLKIEPDLSLHLETNCKTLPDVLSYNVIGEIRGSEFPKEYLLAGGHLDAWDKGEGAHDDGAGCAHSIEALRILTASGYKPRRSIRAVLFMNEENGLKGALKYAEQAELMQEKHVACIESDRGGFSPRGFHIEAGGDTLKALQSYRDILEPYGLHLWQTGGSGADISPFKGKSLLIGMVPDSQRYFDHHHADTDIFANVHKRELELGSASIAVLLYLLDRHGVPK